MAKAMRRPFASIFLAAARCRSSFASLAAFFALKFCMDVHCVHGNEIHPFWTCFCLASLIAIGVAFFRIEVPAGFDSQPLRRDVAQLRSKCDNTVWRTTDFPCNKLSRTFASLLSRSSLLVLSSVVLPAPLPPPLASLFLTEIRCLLFHWVEEEARCCAELWLAC